MKTQHVIRHEERGFTLIEIALVLLVISLVAAGVMYAFGEQFKNSRYKESAAALKYNKKALLNFVQLNGYLPCPDVNGDGREDRAGNACSANSGTVPYKDLGLTVTQVKDGWGNFLRYNLTLNVTNAADICSSSPTRRSANYFCKVNAPIYDMRTPPTANTTDRNNLTILDATGGNKAADQMSVVLVARNSNGGANCNTLSADEKENCNGDNTFVLHAQVDQPATFFDDQLVAISGYEIKRPQNFTSATFSGTPSFMSKFSAQHTKLYNNILAYGSGGGNGGRGENVWLTQMTLQDKTLRQLENAMLYQSGGCAAQQGIFSQSGAFTTVSAVNGSMTLNSGNTKANLKVKGSVGSGGILLAGNESNTVYVAGNMNGQLRLGNGRNDMVVAGALGGSVLTGANDDSLRICQTNISKLSPCKEEGRDHDGDKCGTENDNDREYEDHHHGDKHHGEGHHQHGEHHHMAENHHDNDHEGDHDHDEGGHPTTGPARIELGDGDDQLLAAGSLSQTIDLGNGTNIAYFFKSAAERISGGSGKDLVLVLGDSGSAMASSSNDQWNLKKGSNAVRILGNCYNSISVGDDADLFIIGGQTAGRCNIATAGGTDLIMIGGTLNTRLDSGEGNDFVLVHATTSSTPTIRLGSGNDVLVVDTALNSSVNAGSGDDRVVLKAGVASAFSGTVNGGVGDDTLILDYTRKQWDDNKNGIRNRVSGFETVKLKDATIVLNP